MRISIIINNYNYGCFLGRAIDSALAQKYPNIEVIVVDDGSTDHSSDIIRSYESQILPIFKKNGGQGSAFNAGFAASTGDVIIFLDSDDELCPMCASEVARAMRPGVAKVHFNLLCVDEFGVALRPYSVRPLPQGKQAAELSIKGTVTAMPTSGNAFSREFLRDILPMPEVEWRRSPDAYLFNAAVFAGETAAIQSVLGFYRIHGSNVSGMIVEGRVSVSRIKEFLEREIITDAALVNIAPRYGFQFAPGTLTRSLGHVQQLFFLKKLDPYTTLAPCSLLSVFLNYEKLLIDSNVALLKRFVIGMWSLAILIAPSWIATELIAVAYLNGAVFSASRITNVRRALNSKRVRIAPDATAGPNTMATDRSFGK